MRNWSKLCPILSVVTSLSIAFPAQAMVTMDSCNGGMTSIADKAITQAVDQGKIKITAADAREAIRVQKQIDKLDEKLRSYRAQNGIWETAEITDKRLNALTMETMIMADDLKTLNTLFGGEFDIAERNAIIYYTSDQLLTFYRNQVKADPSKAADLAAKIDEVEKNRDDAKATFLSKMETVASLMFVLDVMKTQGVIIDVNTLFGSTTNVLDINGNVVDLQKPGQAVSTKPPVPVQAAVSQAAVPPAGPVTSAANAADADKDADSKPQPVDNKELNTGMRAFAPDQVRARATAIYNLFGSYFKSDAVQKQIAYVKQETGLNFPNVRPTFKELEELRKKIGPDWSSAAQQIKYRTDKLWEERILWAKLTFLGPQLSESLTNWLGGIEDSKLKAALRPIGLLAGLEYDRSVRRRHLANILKVMALKDPRAQFQAILNYNAAGTYNNPGEFIVTLMRFAPAHDDVVNLFALLEASTSSYEKAILKQWEGYRDEALARGQLPLRGQEPAPLRSVISAGVGIGYMTGMGYVSVETATNALHHLQSVITLIPHLFGH